MIGDGYKSPLSERYTSSEMSRIFSAYTKYTTWRKLWLALARAHQKLGLPITNEQIGQLEANVDKIDFEAVKKYESRFHHDVMAHLYAYADQCPLAKPIIHLGATSCYVTDNGDLIQMRQAMLLIQKRLKTVLTTLGNFAKTYKNCVCLGFTHLQPAQLTTVGKRACLWAQDFLIDLHELEYRLNSLRFLGNKGATGTQAASKALLKEDDQKICEMEKFIANEMGFNACWEISGQTYTRKQDMQLLQTLSGIAVSAHKFASDIRLLAHMKEIEEPFDPEQIGSSAMPHKRNPILSERICSLARFVMSLSENPTYTAATQWLERTLDDSANRRISIPESFLATDAILNLVNQIASGLVVNEQIIAKRVEEELPFLVIENILMEAVRKGGDRQTLHEKLRQYSLMARERVLKGETNRLLDLIKSDPSFSLTADQIEQCIVETRKAGLASSQVDLFVQQLPQ